MGTQPVEIEPEQLQLSFATRYLTMDQVAELLAVPKSFIYRRTARGHGDPIPHYRLGGHLRFKLAELEAWMDGHRAQTQPEAPVMAALLRERGSHRSSAPRRRKR